MSFWKKLFGSAKPDPAPEIAQKQSKPEASAKISPISGTATGDNYVPRARTSKRDAPIERPVLHHLRPSARPLNILLSIAVPNLK
jgi:hypothetical protein